MAFFLNDRRGAPETAVLEPAGRGLPPAGPLALFDDVPQRLTAD